MRFTFLPTLIFLLISGCELSENSDSFEKSFVYSYQKNQEIKVDTVDWQAAEDSSKTLLDVSTNRGNHLVFKFQKIITAPPNVADGGSTMTVYFQISPDTKEFNYENDELKQAKVFYERACFCPFIGALQIKEGYIRGQQLSNNIWTVSASLQTESRNESFDIQFDGNFINHQE